MRSGGLVAVRLSEIARGEEPCGRNGARAKREDHGDESSEARGKG